MTRAIDYGQPSQLPLAEAIDWAVLRQHVGREAVRRLDPVLRSSVDIIGQEKTLAQLFDERVATASVVIEKGAGAALGIATEVTSGFDGSHEGLLHTFSIADHAALDLGESVIEAIEDAAQGRQWRFLRACVPIGALRERSVLHRRGWHVAFTIVSKHLEAVGEGSPRNSAIRTRSATEADIEFLLPLVTDSLLQGLVSMERRVVDARDVQRYAMRFVEGLLADDHQLAIVGEDTFGPVGYATVDVQHVDEFTGAVYAMLHDIYSVQRARGGGNSDVLASAAEFEAQRAGRTVITGTVSDEGPTTATLLTQVRRRGWVPRSIALVRGMAMKGTPHAD